MKKLRIVGLIVAAGLLTASEADARSANATTVKVPFAFAVGTQSLPAGTYQIELVTQSQAGKDPLEVVVLRGKGGRQYASFVSMLMDGQASAAGLMFHRVEGREILTEIRAQGKRLAPSATQGLRADTVGADVQLIAEQSLLGR